MILPRLAEVSGLAVEWGKTPAALESGNFFAHSEENTLPKVQFPTG